MEEFGRLGDVVVAARLPLLLLLLLCSGHRRRDIRSRDSHKNGTCRRTKKKRPSCQQEKIDPTIWDKQTLSELINT